MTNTRGHPVRVVGMEILACEATKIWHAITDVGPLLACPGGKGGGWPGEGKIQLKMPYRNVAKPKCSRVVPYASRKDMLKDMSEFEAMEVFDDFQMDIEEFKNGVEVVAAPDNRELAFMDTLFDFDAFEEGSGTRGQLATPSTDFGGPSESMANWSLADLNF